MKLHEVKAEHREDGVRFIGSVEKQGSLEMVEVYFDFTSAAMASAEPNVDAFAAAMLIPAMRANEPLEIVPPISPRLHLQLPRIRDLFNTWYPEFARIEISTVPGKTLTPTENGAGAFFSGGVDSFYTLLKYRSGSASVGRPLSHIIFMRGVETRLEESRGVDKSEDLARSIAEKTGVEIIVGETNFRTSLQGPDTIIHWERHYHGSALAAVGLSLEPVLGIVCIPSAFTYNHLVRHGSSPLLDEMYSTEKVAILHDGAEADRASKVGKIIEWNQDLVLENLRVCHFNDGGAFNCGKCPKCVRTAVPLDALGVLDDARLFPDVNKKEWSRTLGQDHPVLIEENIAFVLSNGADPKLLAILRKALRKANWKKAKQTIAPYIPAVAKPVLHALRGLKR
jgi:hypothetical protein